jgi:hypothetical protein
MRDGDAGGHNGQVACWRGHGPIKRVPSDWLAECNMQYAIYKEGKTWRSWASLESAGGAESAESAESAQSAASGERGLLGRQQAHDDGGHDAGCRWERGRGRCWCWRCCLLAREHVVVGAHAARLGREFAWADDAFEVCAMVQR